MIRLDPLEEFHPSENIGDAFAFHRVLTAELKTLHGRLAACHAEAIEKIQQRQLEAHVENKQLQADRVEPSVLPGFVDDGAPVNGKLASVAGDLVMNAVLPSPPTYGGPSNNVVPPGTVASEPLKEVMSTGLPLRVANHNDMPTMRHMHGLWTPSGPKGNRSSTIGARCGVSCTYQLSKASTRGPADLPEAADTISDSEVHTRRHTCFLDRLVFLPSCAPMLIWLTICPVLLVYDAITIPMFSSLPTPKDPFTTLNLGVSIYWTIDCARSFFTALDGHSDSGYETRFLKITKEYMRKWFSFDFFMIMMDWCLTSLLRMASGGRAAKALKIVRMARLARLLKFAKRFGQSGDFMSIRMFVLTRVFGVFLMDMFFAHYAACYWCSLSEKLTAVSTVADTSDADSENSWVTYHGLQGSSLGKIYLIALNTVFSMSGFGSSEIYPINTWERSFTSFVGFVWLILVAVTISLFGIWLDQLRNLNHEMNTQRQRLRQYLDDHRVSWGLIYRIIKQLHLTHNSKFNDGLRVKAHKCDVDFFKNLPFRLKSNLHEELYMTSVLQHPFLNALADATGGSSGAVLLAIVQVAVRIETYAPEDSVFTENHLANDLWYVDQGRLEYYSLHSVQPIETDDYICDPALFFEWTHYGRLVASTSCELLAVTVGKVLAVVEEAMADGLPLQNIKAYAVKLVQHFVDECAETDYWGDRTIMWNLGCECGVLKQQRIADSEYAFAGEGHGNGMGSGR